MIIFRIIVAYNLDIFNYICVPRIDKYSLVYNKNLKEDKNNKIVYMII